MPSNRCTEGWPVEGDTNSNLPSPGRAGRPTCPRTPHAGKPQAAWCWRTAGQACLESGELAFLDCETRTCRVGGQRLSVASASNSAGGHGCHLVSDVTFCELFASRFQLEGLLRAHCRRSLSLPSQWQETQNQAFDIISHLAYYSNSPRAKLTGAGERGVILQP